MATRQKKTLLQGISQEQANEAFAMYAKSDAQIQKLNAEVELQCAKIREKYADRLSALSAEREQSFDVLQAYALENQAELFNKRKSLEMSHGTIGFRTGTPKLKTLKGFTWASVLQLVKEFLPSYVRTTDEVAKDKLLADRDSEVAICDVAQIEKRSVPMRELMLKCGVTVVQEESFYVEPKKEELQ